MNSSSIEARDRRLMKKFRNIVEEKEQRKRQSRASGRPWAGFILVGFLMVALILFAVCRMIPESVLTESAALFKTTQKSPDESPKPVARYTVSPSEEPVPPPRLENPVISAEPDVQTDSMAPAPSASTPERPATLHPVVHKNVRIDKIVTCSGIKNKEYVSPQQRFSLKNGARPTVWMNVLADSPPLTLSHVYYVNGRRYCRVPLRISYPRTRTWSNVSLSRQDHAGHWRVDITTDKGEILGSTDFTVEL